MVEMARILELLAHAVEQADGWHDDDHGGPIQADPLMDEARQLLREQLGWKSRYG